MVTVMIINEETDKLETTYQIKEENVKKEVTKLKKLYDDVSVDIDGDIIAWK